MKREKQSKEDLTGPSFPDGKGDGSGRFLIVGIGASAGGIEAAQEFFFNVPADSGMAYVFILHLSPDRDSQLAAVLRQTAKIPVTQVTRKVRVVPNHIYVIPPSQHLQMEDGHITVTPNTNFEEQRAPVDIFFRTLAESHESRAVAVVLSGIGANGSMGIKRVKEKGGAAFVQSPTEALFNEMPRNSIATALIDDVLPVAKIPAKIIAYRESLGTIEIAVTREERPEEQQQALREIFSQLRLQTGHDFSNYKRPTLLRRIERRLMIRNLFHLPAYAGYMRQHPEETQLLLKDLLISVTNFFRDKSAFEFLNKEVLAKLVQSKKSGEAFRIWVVGCATGEEAYSLAMLCAEYTLGAIDAPKVQIFATDLDEAAISTGREGLYTINDAADVSPERLRRFFVREGDEYRARRELREMILFAVHNVIKDPPFSHIDLISCRNMLIYLNHTAQERVMETFHFALNPGAYLFLGNSESPDGASDLYATVSRESHVYQSRPTGMRSYPVPATVRSFKPTPVELFEKKSELEKPGRERVSYGDLHQRLLEKYAPPSIIVNEDYDILHLSENVGVYLRVTGGEPSKNLLKLIRPELRLELRSALYQANQRQINVETGGIKLSVENKEETVTIHVRPVLSNSQDTARGFLLILFESGTKAVGIEERVSMANEPMVEHLEEELSQVKVRLRTTSEQFELQAEEMKASNEELQALNEELRSAAEELETSKEELQSINEELTTVNQELKVKIEETSLASNNLKNLINSTDIGTIFLDRSFRVNLFTPAARQIFNLIASDFGRPLTDITSKLEYADLLADADTVLHTLQPIEKEVGTATDETYLMHIMPYRTSEDRINGVVISFINITERKHTERRLFDAEKVYSTKLEHKVEERTAELKASREQYASLVENTPDLITRWDQDLQLVFANSAYGRKTELRLEQFFGENILQKGRSEDTSLPYFNSLRKVFETGEPVEHFDSLQTSTGESSFFSRMVPEKNDRGEVETVLAIARDITDIKRADQEVVRLKEEIAERAEDKYRTLFNSIDEGFCVLELILDETNEVIDFRYVEVNPVFSRQTGLSNVVGKLGSEVSPNLEPHWLEFYSRVFHAGIPQRMENYHHNTERWYDVYSTPIGLKDSRQICNVFNDITERKQNERRQAFLITLNDTLRALTSPVKIQRAAMQMLGEYLNVSWAQYYEVEENDEWLISATDFAEGAEGGTARARMDDFGTFIKHAFRAGQTLAVADVSADSRLTPTELEAYDAIGFSAYIGAPIIKGGRFVGGVGIHHSTPRQWTAHEVNLVNDIAERTWAAVERAKAEEGLRKSEERLKKAMQINTIGVVFLSDEGEFKEANEAFLKMTGYTRGQFESERVGIENITLPEWMPRTQQAMEEIKLNGVTTPYEKELIRPDGTRWWGLFAGARIGHNENVEYAVDITERKQLEQQKEDFIGIASHELRTPVTSIKGYVELISHVFKDSGDEPNFRLTQKLNAQVDRMVGLIQSLLDTAQIEEGKLNLNKESFDLQHLIVECAEDFQRIAPSHKILVDSQEKLEVIADKDRINQVLINLISNAVKYSPGGGEVQLHYKVVGQMVQVAVHDNGTGISKDSHLKVFDRFFREESTRSKIYPGMGLGLYIAANIIKRHSGAIWLESEIGKGSTFYFTLPLVDNETAP